MGDDRSAGLGGSDIAAILGLHPSRTRLHVYLEKLGEADPDKDDEAKWWGRALEPVLLRAYAEKYGVHVRPGRLVASAAQPWRLGHTDGEVDEHPVGMECKTEGIVGFAKRGDWGDEGTDQIPEQHLLQCHWYLSLVPEWERMDVPALVAGFGMRVYRVERNADLEAFLVEAGNKFWRDHVAARKPPELDASDEAARWLARVHPKILRPELLEGSPNVNALAEELAETRRARKAHEEHESLIKNRLREVIGDAAGLKGPWGHAKWSEKKKGGRVLTFKFKDEPQETSA